LKTEANKAKAREAAERTRAANEGTPTIKEEVTFVKPEIKTSPETNKVRTPQEIQRERAQEESVKAEEQQKIQNLGFVPATTFTSIPEVKKATEAETATKTGTEQATEAIKPEVEKQTKEEKKIGGEGAGIKEATEAIKETAKKEAAVAEEAKEAKEAELEAEKMSLKDMAAAAPTSIFDLVKSKQKGEDVKNLLGKGAFNLAKYLGSASFDVRDTKLGKFLSKETGFDFGKAEGKGGFDKMQKDIIENEEKFAKSLSVSGQEVKNLNKMKLDLARFANQKEIDDVKETIKKNEKAIKDGKLDQVKELTQRQKEVKEFNDRVDAADKKLKKKTAERQATYADRVEKGGVFGYTPTQLEAAQKIRSISKEKTTKDKVFDDLKKIVEEDKKSEPAPEKPTPAPAPSPAPKPDAGGDKGPKK
jgi:hypothetical protein